MNPPEIAGQAPGQARPRGNYSHLRRAGPLLFSAGIGPRRSDNTIAGASVDAMGTMTLDIRAQTRAVLEAIRAVLATEGATLDDVVEATCFLVNMADFGGYNETWAEFFGPGGPARTTVAVHQLPRPEMLIEVKVIAYKP